MFQYDIISSVVLYKNNPTILKKAIFSFLDTNLNVKLFLVDNSPTDKLRTIVNDSRIEYIFNNDNIGFGKAHNIILRQSSGMSKYHLVLNPDVYFEGKTLESLFEFMERSVDVGLVVPKIVNFDGEMQYLCKRLPDPIDLIFRRFFSKVSFIGKTRMDWYEMREKDYQREFIAPSLSGCFMFLRTEALKKIGFFDERYFMYLEDIDLSRRIFQQYKNVYLPSATIYHGHAKGSYKNLRLLLIHIQSAVKYFNKWGWFMDKERRRINTAV